MGNVKFILETEQARAVMGILKTMEAMNKADNAGKKMVQTGKNAREEFSKLGTRAQNDLIGMATGAVTISTAVMGLKKVWSSVVEEINKAYEAQKKQAEQSYVFQDSVKKVANQFGVLNKPGGMASSEAYLKDVMRGGGLRDSDAAANIIVSTNAVFGHLAEDVQKDFAKEFAAVSNEKMLDPESTGALVELASKSGAKTLDELKVVIEKMFLAQQKSPEGTFKDWVTGAQTAAAELMTKGSSLDAFYANYGMSRLGAGSAEEASQRQRQAARTVQDEKVRKVLAKRSGMSETEFMEKDFDFRLSQLGDWVVESSQTPAGIKAMEKAGLQGRELGYVQGMFGQENRARRDETLALLQTANVADYNTRRKFSEEEGVIAIGREQAETNIIESEATSQMRKGERALSRAAADLGQIRSGIQKEPRFDVMSRILHPSDEGQKQLIAQYNLLDQAKPLIDLATQSGDLTPGLTKFDSPTANTSLGQNVIDLLLNIQKNTPSLFNNLTPQEIGEFNDSIKGLTLALQDAKKTTEANTKATNKNTDANDKDRPRFNPDAQGEGAP